MPLKQGDTVMIYMVRKNGALEDIFTSLAQAEAYMRSVRKNSEYWRIHEKRTVPHQIQGVSA